MTKADLIAALATVPDSADLRMACQCGLSQIACIIRAAESELWLGSAEALADELAESGALDPAEAPSLIWHNPSLLPPPPPPDVVAIALSLAKNTH